MLQSFDFPNPSTQVNTLSIQDIEDEPLQFKLIERGGEKFLIQTQTPDEKSTWFHEIRELLTQQQDFLRGELDQTALILISEGEFCMSWTAATFVQDIPFTVIWLVNGYQKSPAYFPTSLGLVTWICIGEKTKWLQLDKGFFTKYLFLYFFLEIHFSVTQHNSNTIPFFSDVLFSTAISYPVPKGS